LRTNKHHVITITPCNITVNIAMTLPLLNHVHQHIIKHQHYYEIVHMHATTPRPSNHNFVMHPRHDTAAPCAQAKQALAKASMCRKLIGSDSKETTS
jgi:hypothetical protein